MLKLIVGVRKGSGKTETLIRLANDAVGKSNGDVICIEKGSKLIHGNQSIRQSSSTRPSLISVLPMTHFGLSPASMPQQGM